MTGHAAVDAWIDRGFEMLTHETADRFYNLYMDTMNLRDNRFMSKSRHPLITQAQQWLFLANIPFAGAKRERDLLRSMDANGITDALVVPFEPFSLSERVMRACEREPRLHAVAHVASFHPRPTERIRDLVRSGAVAVFFHPVIDQMPVDSDYYRDLVVLARDENVPIICRTGFLKYPTVRDPEAALIDRYAGLVGSFPDVRFVMSHSNMAEYQDAIAFARKFPNVVLDTAWQTANSIHTLIDSLGADRVLFATDWPILGDQQRVQKRIFNNLGLSERERERVSFKNALEVFPRLQNKARLDGKS